MIVDDGPLKATDRATDPRAVDRWDGGVGWIAHPDELIERTSHALATDAGVWLIDPMDAEGVDDLIADYGDVAGVAVLFGHHVRDAAALARRHGVAVHLPDGLRGAAGAIDAPRATLRGHLPGTGYRVRRLYDVPGWRETVLYRPTDRTLVVPEAVGSVPYKRAPGERVGVHPLLRPLPPRRLGRLSPERLLVGHGEGVLDGATPALAGAIDGARGRAVELCGENARLLGAALEETGRRAVERR